MAYDAIITRGNIPDNGTLVDEPALLVQSLTITPAREKKTFKGATNKAIAGIQYTNPTITFAFSCIISEETGLAAEHPGNLVTELANFAGDLHGFSAEDGIMVFEDPVRKLDTENPDMLDFSVVQYPFAEEA
jgi:hypothetical protein